jgi:hypothetical protein
MLAPLGKCLRHLWNRCRSSFLDRASDQERVGRGCLFRDQGPRLRCINGSAEEIPLGLAAVQLLELLQLGRSLHALGDHIDPQLLRHRNNRVNDPDGRSTRAEGAHERAVDLESGDGESVEITQRGVPGTEVIDDDTDPLPGQLVENTNSDFGLLEQGGLRQFEMQVTALEPR